MCENGSVCLVCCGWLNRRGWGRGRGCWCRVAVRKSFNTVTDHKVTSTGWFMKISLSFSCRIKISINRSLIPFKLIYIGGSYLISVFNTQNNLVCKRLVGAFLFSIEQQQLGWIKLSYSSLTII